MADGSIVETVIDAELNADATYTGGAGITVVSFQGAAAHFAISSIDANGVFTLSAIEGTAAYDAGYRTYTLSNIQKLRFDYTDELTGTVLSQYKTIDDYSNSIGSELPALAFGQTQTAFIQFDSDVDIFKVEIPQSGYYRILGQKSGDSWRILDAEGNQVVDRSSNQTWPWSNADDPLYASFQLSEGTYYISVSGSSGDSAEFKFIGQALGTDGADTIVLAEPFSFVRSGGGDDSVTDTVSDDIIYAEAGNDTIFYSGGNDLISGGSGYNTLVVAGSVDDYQLYGERYQDDIFGSRFGGLNSVLTNGTETVRFQNIHEIIFDDANIQIDLYADEPTLDQPNGGYGFGDLIQLKGDLLYLNRDYISSNTENNDYIPFYINQLFIDDDTKILISVDRTSTRESSSQNYLNIAFTDQAGRVLSIEGLDSSDNEISLQTYEDGHRIHFGYSSNLSSEIIIDPGYFGGIAGETNKIGGDFFIQIFDKQSLEMGALSLSYYKELTSGDDIETISDVFFDGQYIAGLGGNDEITGSVRSEIIDGGAGQDTLRGGAGDDQFIINSNSTQDTIEGGGHRVVAGEGVADSNNATSGTLVGLGDSLKLQVSTDLTGLNFTGIESLVGASPSIAATLTAEQFNALQKFDGLSVKIQDGASVTLGDKEFLNGAQIVASGVSVEAGNAVDNSITFSGGDNSYIGGSASDVVVSGGGDDTILTGAGADKVTDTGGSNTISTGDGNDRVDLSSAMGSLSGNVDLGGDDDTATLAATSFSTSLSIVGGSGVDELVLSGNGPFDLTGISFSQFETLRAVNAESGLPTVILTGAQLESLTTVDAVALVIQSGDTADVSNVSFANGTTLSIDESDLTYQGTQGLSLSVNGNSVVVTGSGDDEIVSGQGDNTLTTGDGADKVTVLGGADTISTGLGNDEVTYQPSLAYGSLDLGEGSDKVTLSGTVEAGVRGAIAGGSGEDTLVIQNAGDFSGIALSDIERIELQTSGIYVFDGDFLDQLPDGTFVLGTGAEIKSRVLLSDGTDLSGLTLDSSIASLELASGGTIDAASVSGWEGQITGSSENDTLIGALGLSALSGRGGDDTITGSEGGDTIYGDHGDDTIFSLGGSDIVYGGTGADTITTGSGNSTIYGGAGADTVTTGDGDNTVHGEGGDDLITTGTGADKIYGGEGADTLIVGGGNDTVSGGAGDDVITLGINPDAAFGFGPDGYSSSVTGGSGINTVRVYGAPSDYVRSLVDANGTFTLTAREGTESYELGARTYTLTNIQKLVHLVKDTALGTYVERPYNIDDLPDFVSPSQAALQLGDTASFYLQYDQDIDYQRFEIETAGTYRLFGYGQLTSYSYDPLQIRDAADTNLGGVYYNDRISYQWNRSDYLTQYSNRGVFDLDAGEYYLRVQESGGQYYNTRLLYQYEQITDSADTIHLTVDGSFVRAGGGDDVIHASAGNDFIHGEGGNDTIYAGGGINAIDGGTGYNVVIVDGDLSDYEITVRNQHEQIFDWSSQLQISGNDGSRLDLTNINEVRFSDETLILDSFADQPESSLATPSFGYGDVVRFQSGPAYDDDPRNSPFADTDYIKFQLDEWNIPEDAKFLLVLDRQGYDGSTWDQYTNIRFTDAAGQSLYFDDSQVLIGNDVQLNQDNFYLRHSSSAHTEIIFDPGYFNNQVTDQNKFAGEVFLQLSNKSRIELGSVSLFQYKDFTAADDVEVISDPGFDGLYIAGLGGNDEITGSVRSEIIDGGAGQDTLRGGAGDDQFIINSNSTQDTIEGGGHRVVAGEGVADSNNATSGTLVGLGDSLKLQVSTDLTGLNFTGIESLVGASPSIAATLTAEQFNALQKFDGLSVKIQDGASVTLGDKEFLNGAQIVASGVSVEAGNAVDNSITFSGGDNSYIGGSASDVVVSGGGDDTILTGAGADKVTDTGGSNTISTGDGNDRVDLSSAMGSLSGNVDLGGDDDTATLAATSFSTSLSIVGGSGVDELVLSGNGPFDLTGISFSQFETLRAVNAESGLPTVILTGAQLESLTTVDAVALVIQSGDTADVSNVSFANGTTLSIDESDLTYQGTQGLSLSVNGNSVVVTGSGDDEIVSGQGDNTLTTGDGADKVTVLGGADTISTGLGNDEVTYQPSLAYGSLDLGEGSDKVTLSGTVEAGVRGAIAGGSGEDTLVIQNAGDFSGIALSDIERIELQTSGIYVFDGDFLDQLPDGTFVLGTGAEIKSRVLLSDGTDLSGLTLDSSIASLELASGGTIDAASVSGWEGQITGSSENDTLIGALGLSALSGRGGDDTITGSEGGDTIYGDHGDDTIFSLGGSDIVYGGTGADTITTGSGNSTIYGGAGADTVTTGDGDNTVHGEGGDDLITTGTGADKIYGGEGADTLIVGGGNDTVSGGAGDDVITLGINPDAAFGFGPDGYSSSVTGGSGINTVRVYGAPSDYVRSLVDANGTFTLTAREGTESYELGARTYTLTNIQKLVHLVKDTALGTYVERPYNIDDLPDFVSPSQAALQLGDTASFYLQYDQDIDYQRFEIETAGTYRLFGYGQLTSYSYDPLQIRDAADTNLGGVYYNDRISYQWNRSDYLTQYSNRGVFDLDAGEYYLRVQESGGQYYNTRLLYQYEQITDSADTIHLTVDGSFVRAGGGDDVIHASAGNDFIHGEGGNDTIYAGGGINAIDGGTGYNVVIVDGDLSDYEITVRNQHEQIFDWSSQLQISGNDGSRLDLTNINEVRFSDETLILDSFADQPESSLATPSFGYGDVVRFQSGPAYDDDPRNSPFADTDYIKFQLDEWNIPEDAKFLLVLDRQGYDGSTWDQYTNIRFTDAAGQSLYFDDSQVLIGNDVQLNQDNFYLRHSSSAHTEIIFDPGYFNNQVTDQNKFAGEVFLQLSNKSRIELGSVSLFQYKDFTAADDVEVISDPGFDGLYIAGLGGNDEITGSVRSEIIDGGAGQDTLRGGAGDDQFIINSNSTQDTIEGGGHRVVAGEGVADSNNATSGTLVGLGDSLKLQVSTDLTGLNFTGIESLVGASPSIAATLTAEQFNALQKFDGLSVKIQDGASVTLGDKEFLNGAQIVASGVSVEAGNAVDNSITFSGGDNSYIGGSASDVVVSGGGDDTILTGAGADKVTDTGGSNTISTGDGNDRVLLRGLDGQTTLDLGAGDDALDFENAVSVDFSGEIDGGAGEDTLTLAHGSADLSNVSLSGIEYVRIEQHGVYTFAENQLDSLNFEFSAGAENSFILEKTSTPLDEITGDFSDSTVQIGVSGSEADDIITGSSYTDLIVGNGGDDTLTGGAGDDVIYGGAGADNIHGGSGADQIHPGAGSDIIIAGDGGDHIFLGPENTYLANNQWVQTDTTYILYRENLYSFDKIDGGLGTDYLSVVTGERYNNTFYFDENIAGIEYINIESTQGSLQNTSYIFDGSVFDSLVSADLGTYDWWNHIYVIADFNDIDLSKLVTSQSDAQFEYRIFGKVNELDASQAQFHSGYISQKEDDYFRFNDVETLVTGTQGFAGRTSDLEFTIVGNTGDDTIRIQNNPLDLNYQTYQNYVDVKVDFDGGDGEDTLFLDHNIVDITNSSFTDVENIVANGSAIILTQQQLETLNVAGTASKFVRNENFLVGSSADDNFTGSGFERISGGDGDDTISNVYGVYFTGNRDDYQYEKGQNFEIVHVNGSGADGTDYLSNVQSLFFDNGSGGYYEEKIDDFASWYGSVQENYERALLHGGRLDYVNRSNTGETKVDSGVKEFDGDSDIFYAELAPNSPMDVEVGSTGGWTSFWFDLETGQQLQFWSPVVDRAPSHWTPVNSGYGFASWMSNDKAKLWTPRIYLDGEWQKYEGGDVVMQLYVEELGDYTIGLELFDDYYASTSTLGLFDPEKGEITGYISDTGEGLGYVEILNGEQIQEVQTTAIDRDWVAIELVKGTTYEVEVIGLSGKGGTLVDPHLNIRNENGTSVLHTADGFPAGVDAVGNDVFTEFTADYSGLHFLDVGSGVEAGGTNLDQVGSWTVRVRSKDQYSADVNTTGRIELDASNRGTNESEINELGDRDWFRIYLEKGLTYQVEALGESSGSGSLDDPEVEVLSTIGLRLAGDDDSGLHTDASAFFAPTLSGYYYIGVAGSGNSSKGTYQVRVTSVPDDYAGDLSTDGILTLDQPLKGMLQTTNDTDWFKVGLTPGQYVLKAYADNDGEIDPLRDPYLILRDENGKALLWSDDSRNSLDSEIYFNVTAETAGAYYLEVQGGFKYDIGSYEVLVEVAPADDYASFKGDSLPLGELNVGSKLSAGLQTPGDIDLFTFIAEPGVVYRFDAYGYAGIASTNPSIPVGDILDDPMMRIFDDTGRLLMRADDGGLGGDARGYYKNETDANQTLYIQLSSSNPNQLGEYELEVNPFALVDNDVGDSAAEAQKIELGDTIESDLLMRGDVDVFAVDLTAGERYVFHLRGAGTGEGTLVDPYLRLLSGDNGILVADEDDNSGWYENSRISYVAEAKGTYYLEVSADLPVDGQEIGTGSYTLVTREPDDHGDTSTSATSLSLDETGVQGRINYNDGIFGASALNTVARAMDADIDWFKVELATDEIITISVDATGDGATSRPMFEVVKDQTLIARGDGKETGNVATSAFKAKDTGTYYIAVVDGAGGSGDYTINASLGDVADEDHLIPVVPLGDLDGDTNSISITGQIGISGDVDSYNFNVVEGQTYRLTVDGARDGLSAPLENLVVDPQWLDLIDGDTSVGSNLDGSFSLQIDAQASETLAFTVASADVDTGKYFIELVDLGPLGGDDYADSLEQYSDFATDVYSIGELLAGSIEKPGDLDLIEVSLTAGQRYEFAALGFNDDAGTLALPELALLNSNGIAVASGYSDLDKGRATLETSVFASGTYYVQIGAKNFEGNLGSYTLHSARAEFDASVEDNVAGDASTGYSIAKGQLVRSEIDYLGDIDWYFAELEAEKTYKIDLLALGADYGSLRDSELRVISSDGIQVAYDNDTGAGKDSQVIFTASETDKYFVEITSNDGTVGSYALRLRELYSGIEDPFAIEQTYLRALGLQYISEYSGAGITVGVVDDGIEYDHPDLMNQIDFLGSMDAAYGTEFGNHKIPNVVLPPPPPDAHGTPVAGIISAEKGNETGVVGIAYDADIASTRVKWATSHMLGALNEQVNFDVSNNSWGAINVFADDFNRADWMMGYQSIRYAVENGRDGAGTVFVFSAGNSRSEGDNVNYHNFQNARETITVAATELDGSVASFSTPGAAILVGAYGVDLLTTDRLGGLGYSPINGPNPDYTYFTGTSAAAPVVSGVVALMLEANPNLGYRDVQKILAYTAWHPDQDTVWTSNQSQTVNLTGMRFNDDLGFGVVDARAAVKLAETWEFYGDARNEVRDGARKLGLQDWIPDEGAALEYSFNIDSHIDMEHAILSVDIAHSRLGDLELELISPDGTVSTLLDRPTVTEVRPFGLYGEFSDTPGRIIFDLSSVQYMGEDSFGDWTVRISDVRAEHVGVVRGLSLNVYGSAASDDDQFVITDEFNSAGIVAEIRDDAGYDILNGSALTKALYVDLITGEAAVGAFQNSDGYWEGGERFGISSWTEIEAIFGGDGDDQILGDDLDNFIRGGGGDDIILTGMGSDIVYGGAGSDCVIYDFDLATAQANITYDQLSECVFVAGGSGDTAWLDTLHGVERLIFDGYEIFITSLFPDDPINEAPVANIQVLNEPISIGNGESLKLDLPENIFSDANQSPLDLALSLALLNENGDLTELPEWLSFKEETGTLEGEPEASAVGRYRLLLTAKDDFGEEATKEITIEIGDNRAPIVENPRTVELLEDAGQVLLGIGLPTDPDDDDIIVRITETPAQGRVLLGGGRELVVDDEITPDQLAGLVYETGENFAGDAGKLKYTAVDARNVASSTSISFEVKAVNDAPTFGANSQLTLAYDGEALIEDLSIPVPTDAEQTISSVRVVDLPIFGQLLKADGSTVSIGDELDVTELSQLRFHFDQSVNGPIGQVTLSATDLIGAVGEWSVELLVNGNQTLTLGDDEANELYGSTGADQIFALAGDDLIFGNAGGDEIYAGSGNDAVYGGSGGDTIKSGNGDDYLDGGTGADLMFGGLGDDTYVVDEESDLVYESLASAAGGFDTIISSISLTLPNNIEALEVTGEDHLSLTGNSLDNILLGNVGDNVIFGGTGNDVLVGNLGDDILDGSFGRDQMLGGEGDDTYHVDSRSDIVTEGYNNGYDTVYSEVTMVLSSNVEKLVLEGEANISGGGNALDNHIIGNSGSNLISGGLGADLMEGGLGDDIYVITEIDDTIIDTGGIDTVRTTIDLNSLSLDVENVEIIGLGDTNVVGNAGNNNIKGNAGSNIIDGASGSDTLFGGDDADVFVFSSLSDQDENIITDFQSGEDHVAIDVVGTGLIDPEALGQSWLVANGFAENNFLISSDPSTKDQDDYLRYDLQSSSLYIDSDASGAEDEILVVQLLEESTQIEFSDIFLTF